MAQKASERRPGAGWAWSVGSGLFTVLLAAVALFLPAVEWAPKGGLVGWLLFLAGIAELAFSTRRGADLPGRAARYSGLLTALAGLIFILDPLAGYFPVANLVMAWLLIRGAFIVATASKLGKSRAGAWLVLGGATDLLLGILLALGLPVASLVVILFGATAEIVARFSLILATSFLVSGISQVGMGLARRRSERAGGAG
jgi:uncharacterized membrane protein HdeD (DUF308 family)